MLISEGWEPCRRCFGKGFLEDTVNKDLRWQQWCPICGGPGKIFLADPWGWKRPAVGKSE